MNFIIQKLKSKHTSLNVQTEQNQLSKNNIFTLVLREREEKKKYFAPQVPDVDVAEPRVDVAVVEDVAVDEVEGVGEVLDVAEPRKGQLISKCLFAVINTTKMATKKL